MSLKLFIDTTSPKKPVFFLLKIRGLSLASETVLKYCFALSNIVLQLSFVFFVKGPFKTYPNLDLLFRISMVLFINLRNSVVASEPLKAGSFNTSLA